MTTLQTWLLDQLGLVAFHGPMCAADFSVDNGVHLDSFSAAITGGLVTAGAEQGMRLLRPGRARGTLYGACLSILTAALGTRYAPQTEGKLLFLEDVGTRPYQIDRMLRQMILAGKFEGARGFIFGEMIDCEFPLARIRNCSIRSFSDVLAISTCLSRSDFVPATSPAAISRFRWVSKRS